MARRLDAPVDRSNWRDVAVVTTVAIAVILALVVVTGMVASGGTPVAPSQTPDGAIAGVPTDGARRESPATSTGQQSASGEPESPPATDESPVGNPGDQPTPAATPTLTPIAGSAPMSAAEFDMQAQVIPMGFPLLRETRYQYRDNFLDPRDGQPDSYNHARVRTDGTVIRLHDGIDIYADEGEPLTAVFSGTVIDPSELWQPWDRDRYGRVVVIRSDEPQTLGYIALYAHAERVWVEPGMRVTRGQVLGAVGRTGNAEVQSILPHLHFELRAPFPLDWAEMGEDRQLDAFNPYPSLRAADPKRG